MKHASPLVLLVVLTVAPAAFAQGGSYSFDNFDTRNGVKVYTPPAPAVVASPLKRGSAAKRSANQLSQVVDANALAAMTKPTLSSFDSAGTIAAPTSLRGFTTGSSQVDSYISDSATRNGVDPLLLYSIMHQESSFKLGAVSPKGARGLMQLMPGTAARFGVSSIFDPKQNIEGGARYVRFLLDRFDGDLSLTLAGYNAGEGAVEKYGWRIPPYAETQEYVRRISRRYNLLRDPNAALYAPSASRSQLARLNDKRTVPLSIYERTILTVRLPDGRLQLMSQ